MTRDLIEQTALIACTYSTPCDGTWRPLRDTGDGAVSDADEAPGGDVAAVLAAFAAEVGRG